MDQYFRIAGLNLPGSFNLSALLVLLSVCLALINRTSDRILCVFAMLFSFAGDIVLMNFRGIFSRFPNSFILGAIFFVIAHVFYILSFSVRIRKTGSFVNAGMYCGIALFIAIAVILFLMCIKQPVFPVRNFLLCSFYLAVICLNCTCALSWAVIQGFSHPLAILAAIGSLSFLFSDFLIGVKLILNISRYSYLIWWFYPIGQFLLIIGG